MSCVRSHSQREGLGFEPMSLAPVWVPVTICASAGALIPTEHGLNQAPGSTRVVCGSALPPGRRGP